MIDLKIYKIIGEINNCINTSKTSDEALKKALKIIVDSATADYAILWYLSENKTIHPYYWLCPIDLSSTSFSSEEGLIGKAFLTNKSVCVDNLEKEDSKLHSCLNKLDISSMIIVPFSNENSTKGMITIIKEKGSFTDEEKDLYNILVLLLDALIKENFVNSEWIEKKKIMSINNVTKEFNNAGIVTKVLKGINFDIFEGEFLCLLGESGCGKSTLLNIIGGLDTATTGDVYYYDKNLSKASEKELTEYRRDNVGFIFQSYNLMPNLTAKENLELIRELVKDPMDAEATLSLVGLEERKNNYPSQLSGGQQQRVSIGRAIVKNPKIIMADEPTAALDYSTSIEVLEALENIIENKTTLVMVTHNEEISKMADRVVRFRNGKIYEITVNTRKAKAKDLIW